MKPGSDNKPAFDLEQFQQLRQAAIESISARFYETYPKLLESFGDRGLEATREDIGFTLDFLRPAVEFGYQQSFVDYLRWLSEVLESRGVPVKHVLEMLDWLAQFFEASMPGTQGSAIALTLRSSMQALQKNKSAISAIDEKMPEAWAETLELEQALLNGDLLQASLIVDARIRSGKSLLDIEVHLIQPALHQVGRDWQQNKVSVAQEHLATATATVLMAQKFGQAEPGEANGKKAICACVEGNHHALGLRIVADAFELNGGELMFLGPNLPTRDLILQVKLSEPDLLCLSVSMPEHLPVAKSAINELHEALGETRPAIMLGGLAINAFGAITHIIGADGTATDASKLIENMG